MKNIIRVLLVLIILSIPAISMADQIFLIDDTLIEGNIIEVTDENITIENEIGVMTINKAKISQVIFEEKTEQDEHSELREEIKQAIEGYIDEENLVIVIIKVDSNEALSIGYIQENTDIEEDQNNELQNEIEQETIENIEQINNSESNINNNTANELIEVYNECENVVEEANEMNNTNVEVYNECENVVEETNEMNNTNVEVYNECEENNDVENTNDEDNDELIEIYNEYEDEITIEETAINDIETVTNKKEKKTKFSLGIFTSMGLDFMSPEYFGGWEWNYIERSLIYAGISIRYIESAHPWFSTAFNLSINMNATALPLELIGTFMIPNVPFTPFFSLGGVMDIFRFINTLGIWGESGKAFSVTAETGVEWFCTKLLSFKLYAKADLDFETIPVLQIGFATYFTF